MVKQLLCTALIHILYCFRELADGRIEMKVYLCFDKNEISDKIPYAIICETMGSSRWNTGKRKRAWKMKFTETERKKCIELHKTACDWHLRYGVPDAVKMRPETLLLWEKLGNFCCPI